ncbi:mucin-13 [Camelus dromedarius]|uniref:mucin-13 n=1 Tax=Camelus dromedarius TaxID=9838 RepID=UPI003119DA58
MSASGKAHVDEHSQNVCHKISWPQANRPPTIIATSLTTSIPPSSTVAAGNSISNTPPSSTGAAGTTASSPPPPTTGAAGTTASSPPPPITGAAGTTASSPPTPSTGAQSTTAATVTPASSPPTPSTGPTNPCQEDSCKGGSSCVSLNDTFFCLCPEGQYYNSSTCSKGKIFPGTITFKTSNIEDLKDENSVAYQKLHFEITEFFKKAFNNSDYGQTVIVKISTTSAARSELRAGDKDVDVEVVNIFKETTELNETTVSNAITKAIEDNADVFTGYTEQDRCDYYGCEKKNDQDNCSSGLLCQCKQGLVRPNPQVPMCVAFGPTCDDTCNAENKRQCLVRSSTSADCVCLPGYREDSHGACQPCAFGYSGVGCKDNIYLIITIVGIIAGILILGLLIALVISMSSKSKKKNVEEQNLIENDFHSLRLYETTGFSNLGADGNIFPKVRVNLPKDGSARNPYSN